MLDGYLLKLNGTGFGFIGHQCIFDGSFSLLYCLIVFFLNMEAAEISSDKNQSRTGQHTDLSWNDKMQDQEEAFWRIELVAHCICCSRGSCKSNRTALLQLSIETPFKQNKQNHSLHILWAAQRFCEITPVYKSHSGDFYTIVRQ